MPGQSFVGPAGAAWRVHHDRVDNLMIYPKGAHAVQAPRD